MKILDKILVATDFSESSNVLIEHAISIAKTFSSQVLLVHVLPDDIKNDKVNALLKDAAQKKMEDTKTQLEEEGITIQEPILTFGSPDGMIVQTAVSERVNILMIGAGEQSVNGNYQLGINAKRIIQKSNKPVWVVTREGTINIRSILCPVDFSRTSKRALKNAAILARRFKAELIILSVFELFDPGLMQYNFDVEKGNDKNRIEHIAEFKKFLSDVNLTGLYTVHEICGGTPYKVILSKIESHKPDLLVMGTTGKSGLSRMLIGSVTEKVIREVRCPFITLKDEDFIQLELENTLQDIETHLENAAQLQEDGYFEEAINEFLNCLEINPMHLPAINGIVKIYQKLNDEENAERYRKMGREILTKIWNKKIEAEIRNLYNI